MSAACMPGGVVVQGVIVIGGDGIEKCAQTVLLEQYVSLLQIQASQYRYNNLYVAERFDANKVHIQGPMETTQWRWTFVGEIGKNLGMRLDLALLFWRCAQLLKEGLYENIQYLK